MKKDEIIVLLKEQLQLANEQLQLANEQLQLANEQLQQANATVSSLTTQVNELIERIKSLEELLVQKGIAIDKANRQNKALGKLVSGKKSERQEKNPQDSMTQEEFDKKKEEQAEKRKARKNNGAKRDMHYEMKRGACYDRSCHGCRVFEDVASLRNSYLYTLQHGTHQIHQDRVSHQHLY